MKINTETLIADSGLIRIRRRELGLTQEQLAELATLSVQAVGALERGDRRRPRADTVNRLADALRLAGERRTDFVAAAMRRQAPPAAGVSRYMPGVSGAVADPVAVPRQLPAAVAGFAGRMAELTALTAVLEQSAGMGEGATVLISDGMAGIGKTALVVCWAHRVAGRFPDGQLYVNLRGFDPAGPPMAAAEAVRGFLDAFGVPAERIPVGLEAQSSLYRSILAGRGVLVVLDNARDAAQVRPLLPGSPGCVVVVTSRVRLTSLIAAEGARPLTVDLLSVAESRELLARRLGPDRVAAEPNAVAQIITRCAQLPLALSVVAARAAMHPGFSLATLAEQLHQARGGLRAFEGGEVGDDVRAVFSWSYQRLDPAQARLFRLLALHPGPDLTAPAAASLAGVDLEQTRRTLAELARCHLVGEQVPGRFGFHDLLRAYATELVAAHDPPEEQQAARQRLLDHYLHTAHAANLLLRPSAVAYSNNKATPPTHSPTPSGHSNYSTPPARHEGKQWPSITSAGPMPCSAHPSRPLPTAGRPSPSTSGPVTVMAKPTPSTASATPTTSSASTTKPSPTSSRPPR